MAVSVLAVSGFLCVRACVPRAQLVYIGLRDLDPGEREIIRRLKLKAFSMQVCAWAQAVNPFSGLGGVQWL